MMAWIETLTGVVAERQSLGAGEVVEVQEATARLLVRNGQARRVAGPTVMPDPVVAEQRRRTRGTR